MSNLPHSDTYVLFTKKRIGATRKYAVVIKAVNNLLQRENLTIIQNKFFKTPA